MYSSFKRFLSTLLVLLLMLGVFPASAFAEGEEMSPAETALTEAAEPAGDEESVGEALTEPSASEEEPASPEPQESQEPLAEEQLTEKTAQEEPVSTTQPEEPAEEAETEPAGTEDPEPASAGTPEEPASGETEQVQTPEEMGDDAEKNLLKAPVKAPAAAVTPQIPVGAIYFEKTGDLKPGKTFSVHMTFQSVSDGRTYTFDREITKSEETFTGKTAVAVGEYAVTVSVVGSDDWVFLGPPDSVPVFVNENGILFTDEAYTRRAVFTFYYTGNYEMDIRLNIIDADDGHVLTKEEIGSGIDIHYAAYYSQYFEDQGWYYFLDDNNPVSGLFQRAGHTFTATEPGQVLTLEVPKPPEGYENDSYYFRLQNPEVYVATYSEGNNDQRFEEYPTSDAETYYFGQALYRYSSNWSYVYENDPSNGTGGRWTMHRSGDEIVMDVVVDQDLMRTPTINVKADGPQDQFPIYIEVTLQRKTTSGTHRVSHNSSSRAYDMITTLYGEPETKKTILKIDGPGDYDLPLSFQTAANESSYYMTWRVVDENGNYDDNWDQSGEEYVNQNESGELWDVYHYKNPDYENYYTNYSEGKAYIYVRHAKVDGISVPIHAQFETEDTERFFPVYLKAELVPTGNTEKTYTTVRKLESPEDANSTIDFEGQIPKDTGFNLVYSFYTDEAMTERSELWQNGSMSVYVSEHNRLMHGSALAASIKMYQLGTYLDITAFNPGEGFFPKYVVVREISAEGNYATEKTVQVDAPGQQGIVWFDMMAPDDSSWAAGTSVWNVPNEEEAEDWYNLQYQFDTHGASYDGHYHSDRGWVNGNGLLRAYFSHTYYDKVRDGFIVANPRWRGTTAEEVKIPIRTTVREGLEEEAFSRVPEQKLMVSVTSEAEEHAGYVETANSWSGDAYISQTGDSYITVGNLQPGVYYVSYSTHWYYRQNQWYSWWPVFAGWSKSAPAGEKIIVTAEGKVLAEDGSEYFIDNRYFGAVNPKIFVNTTLPEEFSTVNTTLAARLKGVAGTETANVDVFGTVSVTNQELGTYGFYSNPSNYHNYFFRPTDYNSSESYTIPSGDYELSYYTVDPRDAGRNYRDQKSDVWVSGENIRIHIDEEGNVTKDGQSYVIPNYMLPGLSSVTFDVETTVTEGVKEPFTPGDVVVAWLMDGNNRLVAMGQVEISETGTKPITLTAMQGRSIYPGYGLPDDTRYSNSPFYKVNFATFHENEGQQAPPRINDLWHSRLEMSEEPVHGAIPVRVNTDGSVSDATKYKSYQYSSERQESMLEPLKLDNYSLLLPYEGSVEPDAVTQAEDGAIELKPITDLTQITDKSHYMIVVKNRFDNKFYAVSYAEGKGDQVLLEDVNSLEDLEKGYLLNESDLASKAYVFTANKTSYSDSSVNTQLRSGVKDENGKYISVKMGSSAKEYKPLLSNSAGTVTIVPEGLASEKSGIFSVNKNRYAFLGYINEFLGYKGYTVYSERYPEVPYIRTEDYSGDTYFYAEGQYVAISNTNNEGVFIAKKPDGMEYLNRFVYEVDEKYGTTAYYEALQGDIPGSISDSGVMYPMDRLVYILSDNQEVQTETPNNNYKLVKTFGDFNNTFVQGYSKDMVLVYTDESGKEYALNPKGLTPVKTKDGSADYRTLTAGADNEYIANNNSRIWDYTNHKETTFFGLMPTDIDGSTNQVFVGEYALRKSRSNDYAEGEYLTLNGNPLGKDDTDYNYESQTYIFRPTIQVRNQTNWNTKTSYTLSVLRGGVETWLGVEDGKMVLVDSQEKAAVFDVYSTVVDRYYPAANSDEFNPYYKISSLDDINADDEIVIVYNNNGKKEILACTASEYSAGSSGYYYSVYPAVPLSSEDNPVNIATETTYPEDFKYTHRLDTSGDTKHVYAYEVSDNLIMAQGGATNAIGSAKSANKTQEKYDSVVGLGAGAKYKLWIKEPGWTSLIYYGQKAEVNFFCEDGQFYLRGGKSDAWLGFSDYTRQIYNFRTGEYTYITRDCFTTVSKDKRVPVEIYKRGTPESITVNYYDVDNLNGDPKKTETKSEGLLGLPQDADVKHNGEDYIFVGWTRDKEKAGYLGKDESANLYDFDDLSRVASIKQDVKETCGLLGDCNPEASNTFKIQASDLGEDKTLDLYPVYAWRGRTEVVSWDENGTMILGVSDYKDLQAGHDGTVDVRERWLGSIDIEVYRDGVLVKSGSAPSRPSGAPGRRTINAARGGALKANSGDVTARLYFAYHNDDAADLNIKFIADTVTRETLMPYLRDGDFSTTTPSDDYIIDAVYAEQGGSEDGLKYMYNWLDPEVGGQLDNVRGGSTVKIYVTTRYQVKYYYDNGETDGYVELKSEKYLDENYYTTAGTENAINEKKADSDYLVTSESEYSKLLEKTPSDTTRFTDEAIRRGEYSKFLYNFNEYPHVISIPALPEGEEIPEGAVLDSDTWTVRDAKGKAMLYEGNSSVAPSSRLTVTDTTYGTGNTVWSYTDENLDDVTNTYHLYIRVKRDVVDLNVTKKWDDAENQDGIRPAAEDFAASLHLMNGDTEVTGHVPEITDNKDGTYTVTYTELPQYGSGGAEIVYTVKEDAIEGYTADKQTAADGETITNTHTPETTEISVTKKWDDADDRDGIRPTAEDFAASVRLMSGDTEVKDYTPEITDNDDGTYTIRYTGMPKYKAPGEKIVYTVKEDAIEGYTADKQTAADGETITNTHVPGTVEIRVTKKWDDADNQDGIRPAAEDFASRLHLMSGDTEVKDHVPEITDNKDGTFTIRYTELPQRDAGGEEIVYTVKEDAIEGYTADKETVADGETITNTHTPETVEIRVTKKWDDQNDQANKRPKSVTVTLLADGEQTEKTVKLSEENKWTDTFRDLPANKDGRKIVYTVKEEAVSGYTATVSGDAENGFVITNRAEEVNKPTPPDQDGKKPEVKTGDGYHLTVMLAGVILSGAGLLALGLIEILERKKRRQSR